MRKFFVVTAILLLLGGCVATDMPGKVNLYQSSFDGATEVKMTPTWTFGESGFKIGLYKSSRMKAEEVVIIASYVGIENIADGRSLEFNIDGDVVGLKVEGNLTDISRTSAGTMESSRQYNSSIQFIERLLGADNVEARLSFLDGGYVEGSVISLRYNAETLKNASSLVPKPAEGFLKFLAEIQSMN